MIRNRFLIAAIALTMLAGGCGRRANDNPVNVSVIGDRLALADPDKRPLHTPEAVLISATSQGLVRYDAGGQIEPGLAIRWAISQDGLYYTFRLGDFDGIDADLVARRLRANIAERSRNALKPVLGAIDEIVAVTPEVVEIRLKAPRPSLLDLLAQPELAVIERKHPTGPFEIVSHKGQEVVLKPFSVDEDAPVAAAAQRRRQVMLRSDRAGVAVARFAAGSADLVLGGSLADLPIAQAANLRTSEVRFDPVPGLFGFVATARKGFAADSENRRALAMAIDRDRIMATFKTGWTGSTSLVPAGTIEVAQPVQPGWNGRDLPSRRAAAIEAVKVWMIAHPGIAAEVRVALPPGPGSRLLFTLLRSDWAAIGVEAQRVDMEADADLRLIDEVAPSQSATWYLRHFTCDRSIVCSEAADAALDLARLAPNPLDRSARIADADLRLAELVPFIPIAQPLRWSLVAPRLSSFATNIRGVHPLNHLLDDTK